MLKISNDPFPKRAPAVYRCDGCCGEIYKGDDVWVLDYGVILHPEWQCLQDYIDPETMTIEEAMARD